MFPSLFTTHIGTRPSVWVGCLACFTAGVLRGVWTRAENASSITPADLHEWETAHEELWVFDHEGLPSRIGEMPPSTAQLWGDVFAEVGGGGKGGLPSWRGPRMAVTSQMRTVSLTSIRSTIVTWAPGPRSASTSRRRSSCSRKDGPKTLCATSTKERMSVMLVSITRFWMPLTVVSMSSGIVEEGDCE